LTKVIQETRGVGYVFVRIVKLIMHYMYKLMLAKSKSIWHSQFNGLFFLHVPLLLSVQTKCSYSNEFVKMVMKY